MSEHEYFPITQETIAKLHLDSGIREILALFIDSPEALVLARTFINHSGSATKQDDLKRSVFRVAAELYLRGPRSDVAHVTTLSYKN